MPSGVAGVSEIFCTTSMPSETRPKTVYLPVERRLIGHAHEELRAAAVRLARLQHGRHGAARLRLAADLRLQHTQPARAVQLRLRRILRQRIAALDDPQPDHAMERRPLVGPLARQLDEVADVVRREIRPQIDDERPGRRVNDRLLVGHLGRRQGGLEGRRRLGPSGRAGEARSQKRTMEITRRSKRYLTGASSVAKRPLTPCQRDRLRTILRQLAARLRDSRRLTPDPPVTDRAIVVATLAWRGCRR